MQSDITPEVVRAALSSIPATLARDEWVRIGMAIKSEFPDETGRDLFTDWSATADSFNSADALSTWRSIKASGNVRIGTLIHVAKQHGFVHSSSTQTAKPSSSDALAQREHDRIAERAAEQAKLEAAHAKAASLAEAMWQQSSESGASDYLTRKGVQPYGLRFGSNGVAFVPLRDAGGKLWNIQTIYGCKPVDGSSDKRFLKGGRKSGLWHLLGVADSTDAPAVVLICEGYATGASLREATGQPVAVAFDAGNLVHVAKALRQCHPAALLVVCGDDDVQTMATKGQNPGRDKATAAARAAGGITAFPSGLPEGGSDFNDLHQYHGGATGLDAVRSIVAAAIAVHQTAQSTAPAVSPDESASGMPDGHSFDVFSVSRDGVWHNGIDQEGKRKPPEWVCSRLDVEALTRDQDGGGWGYLLTFDDPLGIPKQWAMPARMLAGDGGEYRSTLLNMGLRIASSPRARNLLTQYIQTRRPEEFASCTDRVGWHGRAFVLPRETIGGDGERIVFQTDNAVENTFRSKGTVEQWMQRIAAPCVGNSRLVFAVACAFAGPLMRPGGMESGGFHFRGDSSSGKTTALKLAASVWGGSNYLQRWRSTDNALEATAAQHSDGLLILDELAQVEPKVAGECAYMLANEQGKARASRTGTPRARQAWRLLFLSAGELGLADHMAEGQKRARTGQEVRMVDIPADAGQGMGAFENLHDKGSGAEFSRYLTGQAASVYGAAGRAWLEWLTGNADTLKSSIRSAAAELVNEMVPHNSSGQVERVGARFALVGAAGEMATAAGLTGWPQGESERAALACFNAWLAARGGNGNGEVVAMLRQVRRFLEAHGEGRFTYWHRSTDDHSGKTLHRVGFRRFVTKDGQSIKSNSDFQSEFGDVKSIPSSLADDVSVEYFVFPEKFRSEICEGFDYQAVCRVLLEHGCLAPDKGRSFDCRVRLPGIGLASCYRITPAIFGLDV